MLYPGSDVEKENRRGTAGYLPIGPISPTIRMENFRPETPKLNAENFVDMTQTLNTALKSNEPQIIHQGWLKKQKTSGFMRGWKQRWCVFYDDGIFRYYSEAPNEGEMEFGGDEKYRKGKGDVSFARLKTFGIDGHTFWTGTSKRIWRFAAVNNAEAAIWFEILTRPHLEYEAARQESLQTVSFFDRENYGSPNLDRPPALSMMFRCPTPSKSQSSRYNRRLSFSTALDQIKQCQNGQVYDSNLVSTPSGRSFGRSFTAPDLLNYIDDDTEDGDVLKAGWLRKQGGRFGFWKRRWCELLKDGTFRYWVSPEKKEKQRKGKGDAYFQIIKASGQDGQELWVETPNRVWIFQAENCIDAAEWLNYFHIPQKLNTKIKVVAANSKYQFWARTQSLTEDRYAFDDVRTSVYKNYLDGLDIQNKTITPRFCDDWSSETEFDIGGETPIARNETEKIELDPNTYFQN